MNRRGFLRLAPAFVAAPAIVRVGSLMPISVRPDLFWPWHSDGVGLQSMSHPMGLIEALTDTMEEYAAGILNEASLTEVMIEIRKDIERSVFKPTGLVVDGFFPKT